MKYAKNQGNFAMRRLYEDKSQKMRPSVAAIELLVFVHQSYTWENNPNIDTPKNDDGISRAWANPKEDDEGIRAWTSLSLDEQEGCQVKAEDDGQHTHTARRTKLVWRPKSSSDDGSPHPNTVPSDDAHDALPDENDEERQPENEGPEDEVTCQEEERDT